ncbi:Hypothetical protein ORPV_322 [Orpheovirus IHUMI-LCC2]|uniref:Uncharacterized protein n=1 Tax=Orpheovirus IHUMI-LCC2 TaxID=2023057 RepID=A0A2I2L3W0_9VIRU|nr:Hypothetical protein ORPV_322 [Orpheovirus IHUMI-LCC2]SNW62226.1 Hypothetical protein ORPV_322 [Orpheovirus IHUMI-LCC2]
MLPLEIIQHIGLLSFDIPTIYKISSSNKSLYSLCKEKYFKSILISRFNRIDNNNFPKYIDRGSDLSLPNLYIYLSVSHPSILTENIINYNTELYKFLTSSACKKYLCRKYIGYDIEHLQTHDINLIMKILYPNIYNTSFYLKLASEFIDMESIILSAIHLYSIDEIYNFSLYTSQSHLLADIIFKYNLYSLSYNKPISYAFIGEENLKSYWYNITNGGEAIPDTWTFPFSLIHMVSHSPNPYLVFHRYKNEILNNIIYVSVTDGYYCKYFTLDPFYYLIGYIMSENVSWGYILYLLDYIDASYQELIYNIVFKSMYSKLFPYLLNYNRQLSYKVLLNILDEDVYKFDVIYKELNRIGWSQSLFSSTSEMFATNSEDPYKYIYLCLVFNRMDLLLSYIHRIKSL